MFLEQGNYVLRTFPASEVGTELSDHERVALADGEAAAWFLRRGWAVRSNAPDFRLVADARTFDHFTLMRLWHTPATLEYSGDDSDIPLLTTTVGVSGLHSIEASGTQFELAAKSMLVQSPTGEVRLDAAQAVSRIVCITPASRVAIDAPKFASDALVIKPDEYDINVLIATALASLKSAPSPSPLTGSRSKWQRGIEFLLAATLSADPGDDALDGNAYEDLLSAAFMMVSARLHDMTFGVRELEESLGISHTHLNRIFRSIGTTPGAYIRRVRLARARTLLPSHRPSSADWQRAAESAGFSSVRALKDAMRAVEATEEQGAATGRTAGETVKR